FVFCVQQMRIRLPMGVPLCTYESKERSGGGERGMRLHPLLALRANKIAGNCYRVEALGSGGLYARRPDCRPDRRHQGGGLLGARLKPRAPGECVGQALVGGPWVNGQSPKGMARVSYFSRRRPIASGRAFWA